MKLASDVEFHEDIRLLVYRPRGLLSEASVNKIIQIVEDLEARFEKPFNRFFDTLGHDEVELNYRYVIQISLHRVLSYLNRPPVKSAILATDSAIIHYCQLHAIITKDSPINVRIFQEREEAAQWLGVPLLRLAPKSPAGER
jgi:precorrin-6x reductase